MPCVQISPGATPLYLGVHSFSSGPHATEEDCLNACKEGACCEGTTCSTKPQCQCQGAGQVFRGIGTTCKTCFFCLSGCPPDSLTLSVTAERYVRRVMGRVSFNLTGPAGVGVGMVSLFPGDQYAGEFVMARVSPTVYEYVYGQEPECTVRSFVRFDLQSCLITASFRMLWEARLTNYPQDTAPREASEIDCIPRTNASNTIGQHWYSNVTGASGFPVAATDQGSFPGVLPLFSSASRNCNSLYANPTQQVSFTLPQEWWLRGAFVGFGISSAPVVSTPFQGDFPTVVYESSGSRAVTLSVRASGNPLP